MKFQEKFESGYPIGKTHGGGDKVTPVISGSTLLIFGVFGMLN